MRKKNERPVPLKDFLDDAMKVPITTTNGLKVTIEEVRRAWMEVAGRPLANKSRPVKIQGDRLLIETDSSSWANELNFLRRELLERISMRFPHLAIKEFRTQISGRN
jgi:predicted nucleic acid-binding Zn ribbon protein